MGKKGHNRTNNDLQNTTQKTKDRAARIPIETGDEFRCSGRVSSSCLTSSKVYSSINLLSYDDLGCEGSRSLTYGHVLSTPPRSVRVPIFSRSVKISRNIVKSSSKLTR